MIVDNFGLLAFSFLINSFSIKILYFKSESLSLMDSPSKRKIHTNAVPSIGGLAIFLTLFFLACSKSGYISELLSNINELLIFSITALGIFIIGIFDDMFVLSAKIKIVFQLFLTLVVIFGLSLDQTFIIPLVNNYFANLFLEVIFILGITNSINLIDGIDNLAALLSILISISLFIVSILIGFNSSIFIFLIGSLSAHIFYNIYISRLFLGDSGSLLLGWIFAIFSLLFVKYSNITTMHIPFLILGIPAFDVIYVMYNRFSKRYYSTYSNRLGNMFLPDNNHIHHNLINRGWSSNKVCLTLFFYSLILSLISICILFFIEEYIYRSLVVFVIVTIFLQFRFKNDI